MPGLRQCLRDLESTNAELAVCSDSEALEDTDRDGEHDRNDQCLGTALGEGTDDAGCSHRQFCASHSPKACSRADWRNDEAGAKPADCARQGVKPNLVCCPL